MLARATPFLPILIREQKQFWGDHPKPTTLAAQVEQESLWNPNARLKTSREEGVGFGQLTRAYRADGSIRFDVFSETKALDKSLKDWDWDNRFDPVFQLRAVIVKNKQLYAQVKGAKSNVDHLAFAYAAYNGGLGGVLSDRKLCAATPHCNPAIWFGNVQRTSLKAKSAVKGYGHSFFDINREYVINILITRREKYDTYYWGEKSETPIK